MRTPLDTGSPSVHRCARNPKHRVHINSWPFRVVRYGLCPAYIDDPLNAHPPVCDQPGTRCGEEEIRWKNMFGHTILQAGIMCVFSIVIYLVSVSAKVKFYILSRDLVDDLHVDKSV